jgi:NTE family protein
MANDSSAPAPQKRNRPPFERIALVLQGGGALGAYQAGVYEGLAAAGLEPDWIAGISIGAFNAAIIAGNPPEARVEKLRQFWNRVTWPTAWSHCWPNNLSGLQWPALPAWPNAAALAAPTAMPSPLLPSTFDPTLFVKGDATRGWLNQWSAGRVLFAGAPGFFELRPVWPWFLPDGAAGATSYYDTSKLKGTLESLVDFDRINGDSMRLSIGAVNVRTGNFTSFDTTRHRIRPEHIMASGSLPPAFPAVEIDGEYYWDGGIVSNTPLLWVVDSQPQQDSLVFQVDLWPSRGELPRNMAHVNTRQKEITYSSRTRAASNRFTEMQSVRNTISSLLDKLPAELAKGKEATELRRFSERKVWNLIQLIYRAKNYEGDSKDYEFSRQSMEEHWRAGYHDTVRTLSHPEVLERPSNPDGVFTFDIAEHGRE